MEKDIQNISEAFEKKINLLLVDDDKDSLNLLENMFSSPLFNIKKVSAFKPALNTIDKSNMFWHCWIVDIALGEYNEGLKLLKRYQKFPFTIVFSGIGSMTVASEAMHLGAMNVFDKKQQYINSFFEEVCKVAALGFILKGKQTKYLSYFLHLKETNFLNREKWAKRACVSMRQLERVCSMHSILTTRCLLSFYYSLYFLLLNGKGSSRKNSSGRNTKWDYASKDFFLPHIQFVNKKLDTFRQSTAA